MGQKQLDECLQFIVKDEIDFNKQNYGDTLKNLTCFIWPYYLCTCISQNANYMECKLVVGLQKDYYATMLCKT